MSADLEHGIYDNPGTVASWEWLCTKGIGGFGSGAVAGLLSASPVVSQGRARQPIRHHPIVAAVVALRVAPGGNGGISR